MYGSTTVADCRRKLAQEWLLWQIFAGYYKTPTFSTSRLERTCIEYVVKTALRNNVLYALVKILPPNVFSGIARERSDLITLIIRRGEEMEAMLYSGLRVLKDYLKGDYLVIKTVKNYPRIPDDIDVLVKDFNSNVKALKQRGLRMEYYYPNDREAVFVGPGIMRVHLHGKMTWHNLDLLGDTFLWHNIREIEIGDVQGVPVPSPSAEILTCLAHINFEQLYITIGDLLSVYTLSKGANWDKLSSETSRHHWHKTFLRTLAYFQDFHNYLYGEPLIKCPGLKIPVTKAKAGGLSVPIELNRRDMFQAFLEKRAFLPVLRRLKKAIKIVATGRTVESGKIPAERELLKGVFPERIGMLEEGTRRWR